jgi:hypothetical protein
MNMPSAFRRTRHFAARTFALLVVVFAFAIVYAQTPGELSEYDLKTAFLYQFTLYVEWPVTRLRNTSEPLVFGVVGTREMANNLQQLTASNVQGHPIEVRELAPGDDVSDLHVLFVTKEQEANSTAMLRDATAHSVLAVTENTNGLPEYSVINFALVDGKVRFDVSLTNAQMAKLGISSRLLQIARSVAGTP